MLTLLNELLNIYMCQKVAPAAHFRKPDIIQNLPFCRFFDIMLRQIKHLVNRDISASLFFQLLLSHLVQIVSILVCNDLAARITLDRNNHCIACLVMKCGYGVYVCMYVCLYIILYNYIIYINFYFNSFQ